MCFHLHCPVNILYGRETLYHIGNFSFVNRRSFNTVMQNHKDGPYTEAMFGQIFFFWYNRSITLKLARMLVLWRWALPTNSACSTIDRTHQTCGGISADESKMKCILLKWNIFIGLINQTAVWKVLFFSPISFKDPFQS